MAGSGSSPGRKTNVGFAQSSQSIQPYKFVSGVQGAVLRVSCRLIPEAFRNLQDSGTE